MTKLSLLLSTLVLFFTVLMPQPASAVGDSGWRCKNYDDFNFRVCAQVHTYRSGNGYLVNSTSLKWEKLGSGYGWQDRVFSNTTRFYGSNGASKGTYNLDNLEDIPAWTFTVTNVQGGAGLCYTTSGVIDPGTFWDNFSYSISGNILGGAC